MQEKEGYEPRATLSGDYGMTFFGDFGGQSRDEV